MKVSFGLKQKWNITEPQNLAQKWEITQRRIAIYCKEGRFGVYGAWHQCGQLKPKFLYFIVYGAWHHCGRMRKRRLRII